MRSTSAWIWVPPTCCTSTPIFSASARNCGSLSVCAKASRSAFTRSAGTPGGAKNGRPISCGANRNSNTLRSSGVFHPVEGPRIELGILVADQRLDRDGAAGDGEDGAVARRGVGDIVGGDEPARARHVLHDEVRTAGEVAPHVAGERLRIEARAAAGREAHHDGDLLAAVEVRDRVLRGAGQWREAGHGRDEPRARQSHVRPPSGHRRSLALIARDRAAVMSARRERDRTLATSSEQSEGKPNADASCQTPVTTTGTYGRTCIY